MTTMMVDSCVILDIFTEDPVWFEWSSAALAAGSETGRLIMNAAVYAEISARFASIEELEAALPSEYIEYRHIPREAAFLAGKSYIQYRRRGGTRTSPLPDFFIGAHASVLKIPLITRDVSRYRTYFPELTLISPE